MDIDDLVLVSIDDHVVEPPDMFDGLVPEKYREWTPKLVACEDGKDRWMYRGNQTGVVGLNAVVSWPKEEWGLDATRQAEMRPGAYDIHERVRDMNKNGIAASLNFPTFAGFSAGHFRHEKDEITNVMISAYNDWHIDVWCGQYPDRMIPNAIVPSWDPEATVRELRRVAAKGCKAVSMPELPHLEGTPSYHDLNHWGPIFETFVETGMVMCLHIGAGFGALKLAPDSPIDNMIILACQVSVLCAQDLLWGPAFRSYPGLKVAFSEGGIGWIPFYLDRCDRHYTNQTWLRRDFGGKLPSEVFREHSLACYVTDPHSLTNLASIGEDIVAWECDYPHSDCFWPDAPEMVMREFRQANLTDAQIDKITWGNVARFFDLDPFHGKPRSEWTVSALRAQATDVDTTVRSRAEWAAIYDAAHAG